MSGEGQPTAELFCGVASVMKGSQRNQAAIGITEIIRRGQRPAEKTFHAPRSRSMLQLRGNGVYSEAALFCEACLDRRDVSFAITQRVGRRVDRVVAKNKIVFVRSGRAEYELSIGQRFEFDRFA